MHLVSCYIALGGDPQQTLVRGPHDTVSWPEVGVLQTIHGEDAVTKIVVEGEDLEATRASEKLRLISIYGPQVIENVYPGRSPHLEMHMPGHVAKPTKRAAKSDKDEKFDVAVDADAENVNAAPEAVPAKAGKRTATVIPPVPSAPEPIPDGAPYDENDDA
jgi:hypothetical protein